MSNSTIRLTRAQVREVDRRAINDYHIPSIVLMENAAIHVVQVLKEITGSKPLSVDIVCGGGNNGGDGLAVARHLHNASYRVRVLLAIDPEKYSGDALINYRVVDRMKIPMIPLTQILKHLASEEPRLIVDALFGTGLEQPPREESNLIINAMNDNSAPILAIDLPSGLDCDTGNPLGPSCVTAHTTVTFVAEKAAFANPRSKIYAHSVAVVDIGCPKEIITEVLRDLPA